MAGGFLFVGPQAAALLSGAGLGSRLGEQAPDGPLGAPAVDGQIADGCPLVPAGLQVGSESVPGRRVAVVGAQRRVCWAALIVVPAARSRFSTVPWDRPVSAASSSTVVLAS